MENNSVPVLSSSCSDRFPLLLKSVCAVLSICACVRCLPFTSFPCNLDLLTKTFYNGSNKFSVLLSLGCSVLLKFRRVRRCYLWQNGFNLSVVCLVLIFKMSCLRVCQRQRKYYLNEWSDDSNDEEDIYQILTANEDTPPGKKISRSQSFTPKTSTVKFRRTPLLKKSLSKPPKRCDSFDSFDSDCMYRITDTPQVLPLPSHYSPGDFIYASPDSCKPVATVRRSCSFNTEPKFRNISPIYNKQTRLPIPDSSVEIHSCSSESSTDSAFVDYDPFLRRHSSFNSHQSVQSAKPVIKVVRLPSMEKLSPASSTSSMSEVTVFQKVSSSSYASVPSSSSCVYASKKQRPSTVVLVFPVVSFNLSLFLITLLICMPLFINM